MACDREIEDKNNENLSEAPQGVCWAQDKIVTKCQKA